jgi:uncharacterized protein (DUF58 family)
MKTLRSARIGYAASLLIALSSAAALGGTTAYGMAAALAVIAAAAELLAWRSKRQLILRHSLDSDICIRGGDVYYTVHIRNKGTVPLAWAEVLLSSTRGLTSEEVPFQTSLAPFGHAEYAAAIKPPHRGIYVLMVESIMVSDPFRLTKHSAKRPHPLTLTVMPMLIPISDAMKRRMDPQGLGGAFLQSSDEPAVDTRTYRYGDSPRRIHWNLTARRRELMVRQYESVESRRITVLLDLSPFSADNPEACEDALIEACLSVVRYSLEQRIETTLLYAEGSQLKNHTGRDTRIFEEIHHAMSAVSFTARIPLLHMLAGAERAQMLCVFCTQAPGGEIISSLPHDIPVELAIVRTQDEAFPLPESAAVVHITELIPQ